jgi:hypothetical protein
MKEGEPMAISDDDYNWARATLARAGSKSAEKSHDKHTKGKGSPDSHGQDLLREARDEFRTTDTNENNLKAGMTAAHHKAITDAAKKMGITNW